jgi:hypothetical protein
MEIKSEESPARRIQTGDSLRISNAARFDKSTGGRRPRLEDKSLEKLAPWKVTAAFPGPAAVFADFLC